MSLSVFMLGTGIPTLQNLSVVITPPKVSLGNGYHFCSNLYFLLFAAASVQRVPSSASDASASHVWRVERWTMPFQFKCIGTLRLV